MNGPAELDRQLLARLTARFEARATTREPEGLLDAALARVATTRQRARWLASERWNPMATLTLRAQPTVRLAWLALLVALLLAALLAFVIGSQHHGLPSNGRILFGGGGDIYQIS